MQAMSEVTKSITLAALVGPDSWTLLNLLNADYSFLTKIQNVGSKKVLKLLAKLHRK